MQEFIHLTGGDIVIAEVSGKSFDEQEGFVLLAVDCGSLVASLLESRVIEVIRRADGEWAERPTVPERV